jgi:hypothetical protein
VKATASTLNAQPITECVGEFVAERFQENVNVGTIRAKRRRGQLKFV